MGDRRPRAFPDHVELTRGQLASQTGCNIETIRYYENVGLMPPARRTANGYRIYGQANVQRLNFILRCRHLGLPLDGIRDLLSFVDDNTYTCADIKRRVEEHLRQVRARIAELETMRASLERLVSACTGEAAPSCAIIEELLFD